MRCKVISLCVALITVTRAHALTVDNGFIIQPPENGTRNPEPSNNTTDSSTDNSSSFKFRTSINISPLTTRAFTSDSSAEDIEHDIIVVDKISSETRLYARQTREASSEPNELPRAESLAIKSDGDGLTENNSLEKLNADATEQMNMKESGLSKKTNGDGSERERGAKALFGGSKKESGGGGSNGEKDVGGSGEPARGSRSITRQRLVQTSHGPVEGHTWRDTSDIIGYFDIPYGKINGSFQAPVAAQSWLDVHDAQMHTKRCPQLLNEENIGEKDCLTLSIFAPIDAENISVLFHIYDAYSNSKSADPSLYGPDYLVPQGVILVLPNYRVGPMGFLCMQNETAPGNAGLKDLSLALEWVKDNIQLFGGNPANIVVSGDGAAGAYAGYLALSSRSKYYINKVITESGSALSHLALDRDPIGTANILADKIREQSDGAIYNNTFEEVELETIIKSAIGMRFSPCLERGTEPFMNDTPWQMLHDREIDTTFMIGFASYAGAHEAVATTDDFLEQLNANFSTFLPEDLVFNNDNERTRIAQQLREQYFEDNSINSSSIEELSLWYTDASYIGPGIRLARPLLQAGATVYLYEFGFVGSFNRELEALNGAVSGAVRGDIVGYLFRKDETTAASDSPEKHIIDLMVELWVSFIKDGKPVAENFEWNEFMKANDSMEEWFLISSNPKPMTGVHLDRLRLWTSIYEEHFIENSSALRHQLGYRLAFLALLMSRFANKFNSDH